MWTEREKIVGNGNCEQGHGKINSADNQRANECGSENRGTSFPPFSRKKHADGRSA
jgi:hypothetical protein